MDFSRNKGLISEQEQQALRKTHVAVCGAGGMGGVCAEVLVRMGIGQLTLVDHDRFEASNANRQIHCNQETLGRFKVEVLAEEFRKINPELVCRPFSSPVAREIVNEILDGVDIVVNGMDEMRASLVLERTARKNRIPIVDAWITPFASVFTMRPEDPHWEEFLRFPTCGKKEDQITDEDCRQALIQEAKYTLSHFDPFRHVSHETVEGVLAGRTKRPSLAPVTWLSGVLMANEVFKMILGLPLAGPRGIFYDQYGHRLMQGNEMAKVIPLPLRKSNRKAS